MQSVESSVIEAALKVFDGRTEKLRISLMINAENKSATKRKNKALCFRLRPKIHIDSNV